MLRFENLSDVVLVGHSYSGLIITKVADLMPERIRALIYLDAYVGEDGCSALDLDLPEASAFHLEAPRPMGGTPFRRSRPPSLASTQLISLGPIHCSPRNPLRHLPSASRSPAVMKRSRRKAICWQPRWQGSLFRRSLPASNGSRAGGFANSPAVTM